MVATIAAPLAARGAKIGVLMGTAYIATVEAVRDGAVLEGFQQKALSGGETALVETAPGHAIRCLPSGFMDLFAREKARLQGEGVDSKEAWKVLEGLTVGRLRIATKGVDYVDGRLATIDAAVQEAEGMYMIGQVIAMKRAATTVAALHAQVTRGATEYLARQSAPAPRRAANAEAVAIVGMACLYPGSPDLETYWGNILEGRDLVTEVPADRWSVSHYYRGADAPNDRSVSKWGGFIADTPFDPLQFGIPPASLAAIEPVQLLSLEVAKQALKDAGYERRWFDREKTSVIFGAEAGMDLGNQYTFRNLYPQYCGELPPALAEALPSLTEDSFPGMLVNVISGRIANRLGLGGVNYAVTSACASSLTAIELGVKELRAGSSEVVLAGGADFHNGIADFLMFSSVGALSAKGRCRSFDNEADGIALGEGVGVVVLKRLVDAERDGDRAAQGRAEARARTHLLAGRRAAGRGRPGRGAWHRHRGRRSHRAEDADRGLSRQRRAAGAGRAGFGEEPDRSHQVRRRHRRPDQGRQGAAPSRAAADRAGHAAQRCLACRQQSVPAQPQALALAAAGHGCARRGQRLRLRRHQFPRSAVGVSGAPERDRRAGAAGGAVRTARRDACRSRDHAAPPRRFSQRLRRAAGTARSRTQRLGSRRGSGADRLRRRQPRRTGPAHQGTAVRSPGQRPASSRGGCSIGRQARTAVLRPG
jgi:hypothetical protein